MINDHIKMKTSTVKTCIICLSNLDEKKDYCITECNHEFHTSCLFQSRRGKCPLCRNDIIPANKLIGSSAGLPRLAVELPNTTLSTRRIVNMDLELNEDGSIHIERMPSPNISNEELFGREYKSKRDELLEMLPLEKEKQELFKTTNIKPVKKSLFTIK